MKTALLTGQTGFVGKNVRDILNESFHLLAPGRSELDLRDAVSVENYFDTHQVDVVFHCANPNPVKNQLDTNEHFMEDCMRIFLNLYRCRHKYGKMIYLGSGAEYDKSMEVVNIREEDCFRSPPKDPYGLSKYAMNMMADQSDNVYNLCLFACFGPWDHASKFITHCIRCCLRGEEITIRQDCRFDYIHVYDLGKMMVWLGENQPKHHMYNVSGCQHMLLSEIAEEVRRQMGAPHPVRVLNPGLNREYTANGERFWKESGLGSPISMKDGIAMQIKWESEHAQ